MYNSILVNDLMRIAIFRAAEILKTYEGHSRIINADTYNGNRAKLVTQVDSLSNKCIIESIFPAIFDLVDEDRIVVYSEEISSISIYSKTHTPRPFRDGDIDTPNWTLAIDPLCGTIAYAKGIPDYIISICLLYRNHPVWGGVLSPATNEYFYAQENKGAFYNSKSFSMPEPPRLTDALISIEHGVIRNGYNLSLHELIDKARRLRVAATCGLELCYVAYGKVDALVKLNQPLYDYAAGMFILSEAANQSKIICNLHGDGIDKLYSLNNRISFIAGGKAIRDDICKYTKRIPEIQTK